MELDDHEVFDLTDEQFDELMRIRKEDIKYGTGRREVVQQVLMGKGIGRKQEGPDRTIPEV